MDSREEAAFTAVVDAALTVHRELGPGYTERIYVSALELELRERGWVTSREVPVVVKYRGATLGVGYRLDLQIGGCLPVEVKAVERLTAYHVAQLVAYLKATNSPLGALLNFNATRMKHGTRRIVHPDHRRR